MRDFKDHEDGREPLLAGFAGCVGVRGRGQRAAPLHERGDPPLVANSVKTEMRLRGGAGKELLKWWEQSFSGVFLSHWSTPPSMHLGGAEPLSDTAL